MKLHPKALKAFEDVLEPGVFIEARVSDEGKFSFRTIPERPDEIELPQPLLVSEEIDATLILTGQVLGDVPVLLGTLQIPAGFFITAIKGARKP